MREGREELPMPSEVPKGIEAEEYVVAFLKNQTSLIEDIERTERGDINDQHGIDAFVTLRGPDGDQLPCALDFTGAGGEKVKEKYARRQVLSFVSLKNEQNEAISDSVPRFIIDDIDLTKWIGWGELFREKSQNGETSITDPKIMNVRDQETQYRKMLEKILKQARNIAKEGSSEQKRRIKPYIEAIQAECKGIFDDEVLEELQIAA